MKENLGISKTTLFVSPSEISLVELINWQEDPQQVVQTKHPAICCNKIIKKLWTIYFWYVNISYKTPYMGHRPFYLSKWFTYNGCKMMGIYINS